MARESWGWSGKGWEEWRQPRWKGLSQRPLARRGRRRSSDSAHWQLRQDEKAQSSISHFRVSDRERRKREHLQWKRMVRGCGSCLGDEGTALRQ